MNIVIIGASFAGVTAALKAKELYPEATVTLLEKKANIGLLPNHLNLFLKGQTAQLEETVLASPQELQNNGIRLLLERTAVKLHAAAQRLTYLEGNLKKQLKFDKLILAVGSSQYSNRIKGSEQSEVLRYKNNEDPKVLLQRIIAAERITIIGGGQIGIETADALIQYGKKLQLIDSMDHILFKYMDQDFAKIIEKAMKKQGITLALGKTVNEISQKETADTTVVQAITQQQSFESDAVILSVNVRPDVKLAEGQIELNGDGTIKVNAYMQTSDPHIFAVGDCVGVPFRPTEDRYYLPMVNNAVHTATVAAFNLTAERLPFKGSLRAIGSQVFGYFIASCGLTEEEARLYDLNVAAIRLTSTDRSWEKADTESEVIGKLIFDKENHQVVGGQFLSKNNILSLADQLAMAIQAHQKLEDLAVQDAVYYAPYTQLTPLLSKLALAALTDKLNNKDREK